MDRDIEQRRQERVHLIVWKRRGGQYVSQIQALRILVDLFSNQKIPQSTNDLDLPWLKQRYLIVRENAIHAIHAIHAENFD